MTMKYNSRKKRNLSDNVFSLVFVVFAVKIIISSWTDIVGKESVSRREYVAAGKISRI